MKWDWNKRNPHHILYYGNFLFQISFSCFSSFNSSPKTKTEGKGKQNYTTSKIGSVISYGSKAGYLGFKLKATAQFQSKLQK